MDRPDEVKGSTPRIGTGCGTLYMTKSLAEEDYKEVFLRLGKSGGCAAAFLDGIGRLITFARNAGVSEEIIIRAFSGIRCPSPKWSGGREVLSCLDAIAKMLETKEPANPVPVPTEEPDKTEAP